MKKIQIISITLVIIFLIITAVYYAHSSYVCNNKNLNTLSEISVTSVSNNLSTKYANISIEYPKVIGASEALNSKISGYINISLDEFNKSAEENWKARVATKLEGETIDEFPKENEKFDFIADWSLGQINDERISLLLSIYQFSGGAHGATVLKSFNYDLKNDKEIFLNDLFLNNANYLNKISEYSISNLKQQLEGSEMTNDISIREGAGPELKNFEIFTISKNKLTFYFPQYSIGPYALGIKSVDMYNWNKDNN